MREYAKHMLDLRVVAVEPCGSRSILLRLTDPQESLPDMCPGQFVQVRIDCEKEVFLRRPISIHNVDRERNELWLLVQMIGKGSRSLQLLHQGDLLNVILPLGRGFSLPEQNTERVLLVGGGVGTAPLLYLGSLLRSKGLKPTFLLGARSKDDFMQIPLFSALGDVFLTTEDGSEGEKGFVTQHTVLQERSFDRIYCCGPKPMMIAVARYAKNNAVECEVSLENMMACGLGACLCCVEDTKSGHLCVCKDGPVFNLKDLKWQI